MQQKTATHRFFSVILLVLLSLTLFGCEAYWVSAQTDQTSSKLAVANNTVQQAFNAVSDAEKAGANVTSLINQLNSADVLLAQAENAYRSGDSFSAASDADAALLIAQQIPTQAQAAKESALTSAQNNFWYTIIVTINVAIVFILALFIVWRWFKRRYISNLSDARPEVTDQ